MNEMDENRQMSIISHLEELRSRLIRCLVVLGGTSAVGFMYVEQIRSLLIRPAGHLQLIYVTPPEALMVNIRLAILAGVMLAMPVFIYQTLAFILPALYKKEKRIMVPTVFAMVVLFATGIGFAYRIAFPFAIRFFLQFASDDLVPMFTITQYTAFTTQFLLTFGIVFQLPLLFLVLGMLQVVTPGQLRRIRKYMVLVIVVGSAIITPPDVVSQLMIAGPLWILYEIGIVLVMAVQFRKKQKTGKRKEE